MRSVAYLSLAVVLCAFGFLALLSIGAPFLLTGIVMLVVYPWRARRSVLWPTLVSIWTLSTTFVLVAPIGCSSTGGRQPAILGSPSPAIARSATSCTNLLGIDYSGGANHNPPLLPALLAAIVVSIVVSLSLRAVLVRRAGTA